MADYRLPFDDGLSWAVWQGNWDDPIAGHTDVPSGQSYAFDFGNGRKGDVIRAARSGDVVHVRNDRTINNFATNDPSVPGEGNVVVIRHDDGSAAFYAHLLVGSIPPEIAEPKVGEQSTPVSVRQGQKIGLCGNTGHSGGAHLHFEVKSYFKSWKMNDDGDFGPSISVQFEDKNHPCWRPRCGDTLASNNS
jgi:murein DD-endopeptidase MepM/ murein hydrolase activator NlpD